MRDYQKDLDVCEEASERYGFIYGPENARKYINFARIALPWYIKRCMDVESKLRQAQELPLILRRTNKYLGKMCHGYIERVFDLQSQFQQSHEREAALREALEQFIESFGNSIPGDINNTTPLIRAWSNGRHVLLSAPSQSSRYREALAVVEAAKNLIFALVTVGSDEVTDFHINKTRDAIAAYDKAGEGAGKSDGL